MGSGSPGRPAAASAGAGGLAVAASETFAFAVAQFAIEVWRTWAPPTGS